LPSERRADRDGVWTRQADRGTDAGLVAALVLATSPRVLLLARRIVIDVDIAMFTGLVLLCFALSETRPARRLYLLLMYVAAGFGVLTKGPVACSSRRCVPCLPRRRRSGWAILDE